MMKSTMYHDTIEHDEAPRKSGSGALVVIPANAGIPSGHQGLLASAGMTEPSRRLLVLGALLLLALGCSIDRFPLPTVANVGETGFGAGDSSYLLLNRQIVLTDGSQPSDLFINDDGLIYVAESGSGHISVWDQSLAPVNVPGLADFNLPGVKGVAVGPEQLLFAVAGDSSLWVLNLQASREPLTWGLTGGIARNRLDTLEVDTLDAAEIANMVADRSLLQWEFLSVDSVDMASVLFQDMLRPHRVWVGSGSTHLDAVARGRAGKREVFVANNNSSSGSEIRRIRLKPSAVLFTSNPDVAVVYLYSLASHERISAPGTGVGTVDGTLALDGDAAGSLYLTQAAPTIGYWKAQRLAVEEFAGVDYWSFDFALQGRAIMGHERFNIARDITYTATNMFVVDSRPAPAPRESPQHGVQVFKRSGDFLLPLGARKVLAETFWGCVPVDTVLSRQMIPTDGSLCVECYEMGDGLYNGCRVLDESDFEGDEARPLTVYFNCQPNDSTIKVWRYDQLSDPRAVAVYGNRSARAGNEDETVYVADGDRIKLFMLSVSTDDLPVQ